MYVGLIIVFNAFENDTLKASFVSSINAMTDVKVCLVCNSRSEQVFEILTEIAEQCDNTSVVNAKRKKSNTSSVRAGARYMHSKFNLKYLGFIIGFNDFEILEFVRAFITYQQTIVTLNQKELSGKAVKQTFYQSLFSVSEYLEKIASETH
ncbi:MAG: hypothetical protein AAF901_07355 [Bacteroidota bacterium]